MRKSRVPACGGVVWSVCLSVGLVANAHAQGAGRSLDIDTSIRAAGMGGASAGVVWGDPNVWGNVASLSRVSGVRWEDGRTRLLPGLTTNIWLRSHRLLAGAGGVGVSVMGQPVSRDGLRLDYDTSAPGSFEAVKSVAVAASLTRVARALWRSAPSSEAFDLSVGVADKHSDVNYIPVPGSAKAQTWDWGVQARYSPLRMAAADSGRDRLIRRVKFDFGLGYSVLNAAGDSFVFSSPPESSPTTRSRRIGGGARAALLMPDAFGARMPHAIVAGLDPLVALGVAFDHDGVSAGSGSSNYSINHSGLELTLANVLTMRVGYWSDHAGYVEGMTSGWGVGIPLGPWAGFRYDEATHPQAKDSGLPDVTRRGWTGWFDAVRLWHDLRPATGG